MLLWRFTIVCLLIAGLAIVASIFVDRKYDIYKDQSVIDPVTAKRMQHAGGSYRS
ncbi:hypothetical protein KUG47_04060 [Falsochrobactrum sp. TDYN1]|uniref:Uncharacterized protein n=1 Tax=Falsochrobactrum tianjinense TaxID=2706015 RepID=A0A949PMF4_9HYPH|nr:hypothetical protein [Falsochrobactrum sp. TDYN1]MBV2142674.1 hypothetical protein [Falsochrobactrum sp. TDYN1]